MRRHGIQKSFDILDVWFDSGTSHEAVLAKRHDLRWPSDVYLEGNDQYRGWFNSSLMTAIETRRQSPFHLVITHGMVVDQDGRKMSKSLGNYIDPLDILKTMGAEILRAWVSMVDYREEISIGKETLERISEAYRKIRNTFRYLLSNLYDFKPDIDLVPDNELEPLDRWALQQLSDVTRRVRDAYDSYEYHVVYHSLYRFCVVEMSAFYLDIIKDRLYVSHPRDKKRRSAQSAMFRILDQLVRLAAPIFSYTADEVWKEVPAFESKVESVHLTLFQSVQEGWLSEDEKKDWARLAEYREEVLKLMEEARQRKEIGSSLEAEVVVHFTSDEGGLLRRYEKFLPDLFIASQVSMKPSDKLQFEVRKAEGAKCMRCWQVLKDVKSRMNYPPLCDRCAKVLEELAV